MPTTKGTFLLNLGFVLVKVRTRLRRIHRRISFLNIKKNLENSKKISLFERTSLSLRNVTDCE